MPHFEPFILQVAWLWLQLTVGFCQIIHRQFRNSYMIATL